VARTREELLAQAGVRADDGRDRTIYELRYRGQSHELAIESHATDPQILREEFAREHQRRYGYRDDAGEVELVTIRVSVWGATPQLNLRGDDGGNGDEHAPIVGPAVYPLPESTLYVPAGWSGEVDAWGTVHLTRSRSPAAGPSPVDSSSENSPSKSPSP
jgi:N-methylhydantoinase A